MDAALSVDHRPTREPTLKAASAHQIALLEVQALDTRVDQLRHRRETLPEHAEIATLERQLGGLSDQLVAAETELSDVKRQQGKAEADVDQVRARADRDQKRLDAGQVSSPKELEGLQHELISLHRRQSDLEDVVLEIMENQEAIEKRIAELGATREAGQAKLGEAVARRDSALAEIDDESATASAKRADVASGIEASLVALYEKVRAQYGRVGAAALRKRRCMGCQLELNTVEINRIRAAPEDEVLRCEECRRILVRTPESGL